MEPLSESVFPRQNSAELTSRTAVLVLGAPRGGTSSLAGTLVRLGASAPASPIQGDPTNQKGYYKLAVLWRLNNDIQAAAATPWPDWRAFMYERIEVDVAVRLRLRAKAALEHEFGEASLAVIKDPSICRLLPFWSSLLEEAGWRVRPILLIRSPLETALSLNVRNGIAVSYGCLIWLRHMLDAEAETRKMRRAVIDWRDLLANRSKALRQIRELTEWPPWDENTVAEVDAFLSNDLRHHWASDGELHVHPSVSGLMREAYAALLDLVGDPSSADAKKALDQIREQFESAAAIFDYAMADCETEVRRTRSELREVRIEDTARLAAQKEEVERRLIAEQDKSSRLTAQKAAVEVRLRQFMNIVAYLIDRRKLKSRFVNVVKDVFFRILSDFAMSRPNRRNLQVIRRSIYFDKEYYLKHYPDVRAASMDPSLHYLRHGGAEGRDPSPIFSTNDYLARYPDVALSGINALLHYEISGQHEGRKPFFS